MLGEQKGCRVPPTTAVAVHRVHVLSSSTGMTFDVTVSVKTQNSANPNKSRHQKEKLRRSGNNCPISMGPYKLSGRVKLDYIVPRLPPATPLSESSFLRRESLFHYENDPAPEGSLSFSRPLIRQYSPAANRLLPCSTTSYSRRR